MCVCVFLFWWGVGLCVSVGCLCFWFVLFVSFSCLFFALDFFLQGLLGVRPLWFQAFTVWFVFFRGFWRVYSLGLGPSLGMGFGGLGAWFVEFSFLAVQGCT